MAYKNIVFVKLEKRLLNDYRWYVMTEAAQLIYIKLILLAAETYNKIPKNDIVLKEALRSRLDIDAFQECLVSIKENFPKFKENKHFRYFDEFEHKTNYIKTQQSLSNRSAIAQHSVEEEEEIDKEKKKIASPINFLETLKTNIAYKHINLEIELGKMDAWLAAHKGRQKTKRFVLNWLNKIEVPIPTQAKPKLIRPTQISTPPPFVQPTAEDRAKLSALTGKIGKT